MFCQSCLTCIRAATEDLNSTSPHAWSSKILHKSFSEFHQSVVAQCWICRQLWISLLQEEAACIIEDTDSTQTGDHFFMIPKILDKWREGFVRSEMSDKANYLMLTLTIFEHPIEESSPRHSSEITLSPRPYCPEDRSLYLEEEIFEDGTSTISKPWMWKHWFHICSESHEKCRALDHKSEHILPVRLLEVLTEDGGKSFNWKLVHSTGLDDVLYVTLSHCWGASQHARLERDNYSARMEPTSSFELPKTFRDAFYITFKLGFRFIWIDSLCIVQDDNDDWLTQASMMGSIYENASCNIAATWARNGDGGCFTTKEIRTIPLDFPPGKTLDYQVDDNWLYYNDLMEAPLNTRGWVTQERYLARRQLSFAKSQVYWECRELTASEQYPKGIPEALMDLSPYNQAAPPVGKPTLDNWDTIQRRTAWAGLIYFYSNCKFTKMSDKMVALAGLAGQMRLMEEDTYLAGLWKKNIESQLCWVTDDDVRRKDDRRRIQPYEAPTWSWASMDGPVRSDQSYYLDYVQWTSLIEVMDVCVHSKHESKLHSFTPSSLVLRGIAVWARPKLLQYQESRVEDDCWILQCTDLQNDDLATDVCVSIIWDENISRSDVDVERWASLLAARDSNLLCMLVKYDDLDYEPCFTGLVLRQQRLPEGEVSYTRMGVFITQDENPLGTLAVRLGYIPSYPVVEVASLQSTDLGGFIHTVKIF